MLRLSHLIAISINDRQPSLVAMLESLRGLLAWTRLGELVANSGDELLDRQLLLTGKPVVLVQPRLRQPVLERLAGGPR